MNELLFNKENFYFFYHDYSLVRVVVSRQLGQIGRTQVLRFSRTRGALATFDAVVYAVLGHTLAAAVVKPSVRRGAHRDAGLLALGPGQAFRDERHIAICLQEERDRRD